MHCIVNGWNQKPGLVRALGGKEIPLLTATNHCADLFTPRESGTFGLKGACSQYPLNPSSEAARRRSPRRIQRKNGERSLLLCPRRCLSGSCNSSSIPTSRTPDCLSGSLDTALNRLLQVTSGFNNICVFLL